MNFHHRMLTSAGVLLTLSVATSAVAELVAYDPFLSGDDRGAGEYTAGNDMRTMGAAALGWAGGPPDGFGVAHSGSTGNFQANAVGEDSAAVDYEQGGRMQWLGVGNFLFDRNITRQLSADAQATTSSEWWFSIMVNRLGWADPAPNVNNTFAVGGFTDASGDGLQVGYSDEGQDGIPDLVLRTNGVNETLALDAPSSDNQFVLVRLDINTAGPDTITAWADPSSVDPLPAPALVLNSVNITDSLSNPFTQSKYESPGQSGPVFFDEIRLGTSFLAVTEVPEPSTFLLGLAGLAGLGLVARRRS